MKQEKGALRRERPWGYADNRNCAELDTVSPEFIRICAPSAPVAEPVGERVFAPVPDSRPAPSAQAAAFRAQGEIALSSAYTPGTVGRILASGPGLWYHGNKKLWEGF